MANISFHEVRSRDFLIKELARQKTVNNAFTKLNLITIRMRNLCLKVTLPIIQFLKALKLQLTGKLDLL